VIEIASDCPGSFRQRIGTATSPINFLRFRQLREACVVEKTIEVLAPLRGEEQLARLRLEAVQAPGDPGYEVRVLRRQTFSVPFSGEGPEGPHEVDVWSRYDLIRSDRPTPEKALE